MSYASHDDVLARAGRIGGAFTVAGKRPNLTDIDQFLADAAADIDEAVRGAGFDPTLMDANAHAGFRDLNAYGALVRALRALGDSSPEVADILAAADAVWKSAMGDPASRQPNAIKGTIATGSFPVISALLAGSGGEAVSSGGSYWDTADEFDGCLPRKSPFGWPSWRGANLQPRFRRGQHL